MPPELNEEGIRIPPNNELSEIDKAYMIINYPMFSFPTADLPLTISAALPPAGETEFRSGNDELPPVIVGPPPLNPNQPLGLPTTILPPPVVIDQSLSPRDRFLKALNTAGVVGEVKNSLDLLFAKENWQEIRSMFTKWCTDMRRARAPGDPPIDEKPVQFVEVVDGCAAEPEPPITIAVSNVNMAVSETTTMTPTPEWEAAVANFWSPGETLTYSWVQGSTELSEHRKERTRETLATYFARINLKLEEVPLEELPTHNAKVHIYFGPTHIAGVAGWSKIGNTSVGYRQTQMELDNRGGTVETSVGFTGDIVPMEAPVDPIATKREQRVSFHQIGHMLGLTHELVAQGVTFTESQDPMVPDINVAEWFDSRSIMFYPTRAMQNHSDFWEMVKNHFDMESPDYNYLPSDVDLALLGVRKCPVIVIYRVEVIF
jgi:hypothetical protein